MLDFLLGIAVGAGVTCVVGWSYGRHLVHTGQLHFYSVDDVDLEIDADFPLETDAFEGVCECHSPRIGTWCQKCGRRFADAPP